MKSYIAPSRLESERHQRGAEKLSRIPIKVSKTSQILRKPSWIRAKAHNNPKVQKIKKLMRDLKLSSVCEEAACPNLGECFTHGTATFMILGDICTRRCPFCDVAHGKPQPPDSSEPENLAVAVKQLGLTYVVITSVDRDDLRDGGAGHFALSIAAIRKISPQTRIEILVPDFRGRMEKSLGELVKQPSDVFNHNLETAPRLYRQCRPGADYKWSLRLLKEHRLIMPGVPTKSGLMLGLGETLDEVRQVMEDLRKNDVEMLTLGQYLQPSIEHLPIDRFVTPEEFEQLAQEGEGMGFTHVASGPMVRSSYHADQQALGVLN